MIISGENTIVTLKDSSGEGSLTAAKTIAAVQEGATLNIESGSYSSGDTAFWAGGKTAIGNIVVGTEEGGPTITAQEFAVGFGKNSKLTVNNGILTGKDNAVLGGNGTKDAYDGAEVVINGGTFKGEIQSSGYTGCGIYFPQNGKLTINGGNFEVAGVGVCARAGEIVINDGTFVSSVATSGWVGDKKTQVPSAGVFYDGAAKYPGLADNAKVTINGGTYSNSAVESIAALQVTQPENSDITVAVDNAAGWTTPLTD